MDFSQRKLPVDAAGRLRAIPIESMKPFVLMIAPVYVYMKRNEKFVSVKAPMDFFTPEELTRLRSFENLYVPEFVDRVLPYREAARRVRALLTWVPDAQKIAKAELTGDPFPDFHLPPAPYEISDAVIRIIGPLWGAGAVIEPFFVAAFADELCDPIPGETMVAEREHDLLRFEAALLSSGWAVFLALHLGFCEMGFLNRLRMRVFEETLHGVTDDVVRTGEVDDLVALARTSFEADGAGTLRGDHFKERSERVAQKIDSRLERVRKQMIRPDRPAASIRGEGGFLDV